MTLATSAWGLTPPETRAVLRELQFRFHKWDLHACGNKGILPEFLVVSAAEHARLVAVCERFGRILQELEHKIVQDERLLRALGIPPVLIDILRAGPVQPLHLARYDLHPTDDGDYMVSEFNEDVPGGFNEAAGLPVLLGVEHGGRRFSGDLRRAVVDALAPYESIGALFATGYSEDLQHSLLIEDWAREAGHPTVRGSPAEVTLRFGRPRLYGKPLHAAFRYYPGEWFPLLPNFALWQKLGDKLPMLNPLRRLIRQSKLLFALWRQPGMLSADDLAFVDRHAPFTGVPGREVTFEQLADEKDQWVLKQVFGRMGDSVVIGALVTEPDWRAAIQAAQRAPFCWLAQRRFRHTPLRFSRGVLYPAVGIYLVNGRYAGHYSRAAPTPILTHEAYHVATLVEAA